jgi:hypothetical protein
MAQLVLSGVQALQSVAGGTTVNFRLVAYGASSTTSNFYVINNPSVDGDDLVISGTTGQPTTIGARSISGGAAQRSMVSTFGYTFSSPVAVAADAFTLTRRGDGAVYGLLVSNPSNDAVNYVLTVQSGPGIVGGSLPDGIYDLTPNLAKIRDGSGSNPIASAYSGAMTFHRLYGDSNGDKTVDATDNTAFTAVYATSLARAGTGFAWWADYDGNGAINNTDLLQFRKRVGVLYTYA